MTVLWRFKFVRIKNVNSKPHLIIYTCIHDVHACNLLHLQSKSHTTANLDEVHSSKNSYSLHGNEISHMRFINIFFCM